MKSLIGQSQRGKRAFCISFSNGRLAVRLENVSPRKWRRHHFTNHGDITLWALNGIANGLLTVHKHGVIHRYERTLDSHGS